MGKGAAALAFAILVTQAATPAVPVWSVTEGMDSPESVYYDAGSGFLFSSQIVGSPTAKDANGRIVKLTLDGKVVDTNWAKGTLNAPKGLRAFQGTLFVADIDEVVGFEIATGREVARVKTDAKFLNDLATAPDGAIYSSDSFAKRIYVIRNGIASVWVEDERLDLPNGVLVDGNRLIVATDGAPNQAPARLFAIDLTTKAITQLTTESIGTPDGVESDGAGGFYISDVARGGLYHVSSTGESRQVRQLDRQAADIAYIASRKLLIVPYTGPSKISAYDLSGE